MKSVRSFHTATVLKQINGRLILTLIFKLRKITWERFILTSARNCLQPQKHIRNTNNVTEEGTRITRTIAVCYSFTTQQHRLISVLQSVCWCWLLFCQQWTVSADRMIGDPDTSRKCCHRSAGGSRRHFHFPKSSGRFHWELLVNGRLVNGMEMTKLKLLQSTEDYSRS